MANYEKMYSTLFNAITDALEQIEQQNFGSAKDLLIAAQQQAGEIYITAENRNRSIPVTSATECARLLPVTKRRRSMAKPYTPHPIPQTAQLFEPKTANVRGRGGRPLVFLTGDLKGDTLFEKRVSPFYLPVSAQRGNFRSLHRCRIIF